MTLDTKSVCGITYLLGVINQFYCRGICVICIITILVQHREGKGGKGEKGVRGKGEKEQ